MGTAVLDRNLAQCSEVGANFMLLSCDCKICCMCAQGDVDSGIHGTIVCKSKYQEIALMFQILVNL